MLSAAKGIVFVLIAVRIHFPKFSSFFDNRDPLAEMSNWFEDESSSPNSTPNLKESC